MRFYKHTFAVSWDGNSTERGKLVKLPAAADQEAHRQLKTPLSCSPQPCKCSSRDRKHRAPGDE